MLSFLSLLWSIHSGLFVTDGNMTLGRHLNSLLYPSTSISESVARLRALRSDSDSLLRVSNSPLCHTSDALPTIRWAYTPGSLVIIQRRLYLPVFYYVHLKYNKRYQASRAFASQPRVRTCRYSKIWNLFLSFTVWRHITSHGALTIYICTQTPASSWRNDFVTLGKHRASYKDWQLFICPPSRRFPLSFRSRNSSRREWPAYFLSLIVCSFACLMCL